MNAGLFVGIGGQKERVNHVVYGIVVAGGQGMRIGEKKQYKLLAGKPMWERAVGALRSGGFDRVWLVVPESDVASLREIVQMNHLLQDYVTVVAGGDTRFASVRAGLSAVFAESTPPPLWVGVHDAARPFVSVVDVQAVVASARDCGAAILAKRCPDTIKRVQGNVVKTTLARVELWLAQTPQVFRGDWMKTAYRDVSDITDITDDASVMEKMGHSVAVVEATGENRKITTLADLEYAQCLAEMRWGEKS